jgi:hypothetical protein
MDMHELSVASKVEEMRALIFFLDYEVPLVKLHGNF